MALGATRQSIVSMVLRRGLTNVAMGLAVAIDYTLLMLSRFRDERAAGVGRDDALVRTMVAAGRTVLFSAMTVALSMSAMVLFPMYALKSFAYAGVAVFACAPVAAILVTPAAIVLLDNRLDVLDLSRFIRRLLRRPTPAPRPLDQTLWHQLAMFAMRRAVPIAIAIVRMRRLRKVSDHECFFAGVPPVGFSSRLGAVSVRRSLLTR